MSGKIDFELYLTRHGQTWGNIGYPDGKDEKLTYDEKIDCDLSDKGEKQIELLGKRLSRERFDVIFSSPLLRALRTVQAVSIRQPGEINKIEVLPLLTECNVEERFQGSNIDAIRQKIPQAEVASGFEKSENLIMHTFNDLDHLKRAQDCLKYFHERFQNGERILSCAHAEFNTFLILASLRLGSDINFDFHQENTGLTKIIFFKKGGYKFGDIKVSYLNDVSHLLPEFPELTFSL